MNKGLLNSLLAKESMKQKSDINSKFVLSGKHIRHVGIASTFALILLSIATVQPVYEAPQLTEATTGTQKASTTSLNLTSGKTSAGVAITVSDGNGTFAESAAADQAEFTVTTDNYTGYVVSIKSSDGAGSDLKMTATDGDGVAVTYTLSSIAAGSSLTAAQFNNSKYNNMWGYKPSYYNSSANTTYRAAPGTTGDTLDDTSSRSGSARLSNTYTIALAARADYTRAAGTYTNTYVLTAVANPVNYAITYSKNTTDTVTNMPYSSNSNKQTGDTSSTSITLSSLVPVRDGYAFKGWCSAATSDASCSGTTYNPDGAGSSLSYGIDQTVLNETTLYAMWQKACGSNYICYDANGGTEIATLADQSKSATMMLPVPDYYRKGYGFLGWSTSATAGSNIASATIYGPNQTVDTSSMGGTTLYAVWLASSGNMQGWSGCKNLTKATYNSSTQTISYSANTFIALTDTRNSNHGSTVGTSYQDTYAIARLTDGNCWMIENLRLGGSSAISLTTSNTQSAGTLKATTNTFSQTSSDYTTQQANMTNTLTTDSARTANSRYLYGNYYSWAQAINTTTAYSTYSASPQNLSICPNGWRLPLGGGSSQYGATNLSYGVLSTSQGGLNSNMSGSTSPTGAVLSARFRTFPNNFVYSGSWNGSSAGSQGSYGCYWSTTAYNASSAYYLYLSSASLYPAVYNSKYNGYSVRCVVAGS